MKIVQSFWTKPFLKSGDFVIDSRMNGGWLHRKYNYYSITLSALQLRKYYENIELITDEIGKYILIDKLKLPYTAVAVTLNELDHYNPGLWALGKIYAYSQQQEPFIHVDNDIFIWNEFDNRISNAALISQNKEFINPVYEETAVAICKDFHYVPSCLKEMVDSSGLGCSNAGVLGGTDIDFFKVYTTEIFSFIEKNAGPIKVFSETMSTAYLNIAYEQFLFYGLSKIHGREITYLFADGDNMPDGIGFFHAAAKNGGFVHCLGTEKRNRMAYLMVEIKLRALYPGFYKRINELVNTMEI